MNQPDLTLTFEGLEQAKPGQSCYDPAQPWFAYVYISNCKFVDKNNGHLDLNNPTGPSGPCKVRLDVMNGDKLSSGTAYSVTVNVGALDGYPGNPDDDLTFFVGLSIKLPVEVKKDDFGSKYAFRITIDSGSEITESEENNNVFTWEKGTVPQAASFSNGENFHPEPPPNQNWKFIDTAAMPDSLRDVQVRVKNMGSEPSAEELIILTVYKDPVAGVPTGEGVLESYHKMPSIAPGKSIWITLSAEQDFIRPLPVAAQPDSDPTPFSRRTRGVQQVRVRYPLGKVGKLAKLDLSQLETYHFTQVEHSQFEVIRPFSIHLAQGGDRVGFGKAPIATKQPIRIPGKH